MRITIPRAVAGAGLLLLRCISSRVLAAGPGLVLQELPQSSQIPGRRPGDVFVCWGMRWALLPPACN